MPAQFSSPLLGFGLVPPDIPVVDLPAGAAVVRIRSRAGEFIRLALRCGPSVELWYVNFTDATRTAITPFRCIARTVTPAA